jgi:GxxExxY protein
MNSSAMQRATRARSSSQLKDGLHLDCGHRADIIVADEVILEIESIDRILALHKAQLLTYLRIGRHRIGLLMNFNTTSLKDGLRRCVL